MADERNTSHEEDAFPDFDFVLDDSIKAIQNEGIPQTPSNEDDDADKNKPADDDDDDDTPTGDDDDKTKDDNQDDDPDDDSDEDDKSKGDDDDDSDDLPEGADPTAYGIYSTLVDRGYINKDEKFTGTMEALDDVFENLPDLVFDSLASQFPESMTKLLKFGYAKGTALTDADLASFFANVDTSTGDTEVDLTSAEGQASYAKAQLIADGMSADDATDIVDLWEEKGKLEDKAKGLQTKAAEAKKANADAELAAAEKAREDGKAAKRKFAQTIKTELASTGWKDTAQQAVLDEIYKGELNRKSKLISKHPKALIQLANYLRYLDEETGEIDEKAFGKQGASKAAKAVKSKIEKHFQHVTKAAKTTKPKPNTNSAKHEYEFVD